MPTHSKRKPRCGSGKSTRPISSMAVLFPQVAQSRGCRARSTSVSVRAPRESTIHGCSEPSSTKPFLCCGRVEPCFVYRKLLNCYATCVDHIATKTILWASSETCEMKHISLISWAYCVHNLSNYSQKYVLAVDQTTVDNLGQLLTLPEVEKGCKRLNPSKSPGLDGFIAKLYRHYPHLWSRILCPSFNAALHVGRMSPQQRRGVIAVSHKKKSKTSLGNWRPLSHCATGNTPYACSA